MPARAQRAETVFRIFERQLGIRVPAVDTDLFAAGLVDSLAFINLLLHLESEFGIAVPLERIDLDEFGTVERIAAFVDRALEDAPGCTVRLASGVG